MIQMGSREFYMLSGLLRGAGSNVVDAPVREDAHPWERVDVRRQRDSRTTERTEFPLPSH